MLVLDQFDELDNDAREVCPRKLVKRHALKGIEAARKSGTKNRETWTFLAANRRQQPSLPKLSFLNNDVDE